MSNIATRQVCLDCQGSKSATVVVSSLLDLSRGASFCLQVFNNSLSFHECLLAQIDSQQRSGHVSTPSHFTDVSWQFTNTPTHLPARILINSHYMNVQCTVFTHGKWSLKEFMYNRPALAAHYATVYTLPLVLIRSPDEFGGIDF